LKKKERLQELTVDAVRYYLNTECTQVEASNAFKISSYHLKLGLEDPEILKEVGATIEQVEQRRRTNFGARKVRLTTETRERIEVILQGLRQKQTLQSIADKFGVSRQRVHQLLNYYINQSPENAQEVQEAKASARLDQLEKRARRMFAEGITVQATGGNPELYQPSQELLDRLGMTEAEYQEKRRTPRSARLTPDQIRDFRTRAQTQSVYSLAKEYDISLSLAYRIAKRNSYAWVRDTVD